MTKATTGRSRKASCLLIDSGAQYEDGTTDITRTVIVGEPTREMRDRFTRVLKGHIALATAVFPEGTAVHSSTRWRARALWKAGLDYDHGTGHGVGSYLSVHEGPARIAKPGHVALEPRHDPLERARLLQAGAYGIRIENLVLVIAHRSRSAANGRSMRLRDADACADRPPAHRAGHADD